MQSVRRVLSANPLRLSFGLVLLLGAALALFAIACGDDDDATASKTAGASASASAAASATAKPSGGSSTIDYSKLGGQIRVDGSSTVAPISEAVAEEFGKVAGTKVNVGTSGTGGGFEKFCRGEIEIADASRPIKQTETDLCATNGITDIVEFQVGIDALSVVVNPQNDFVKCLTTKQLFDLFKAGGATKWNEIDPSWPADDIKFYYPGTDSGTFDYFVEQIITKNDANGSHRGDGTASEDDNVLAQGIENDKDAIGYFGIAYFLEAGQSLNDVGVDGGKGCVAPSAETALDGTYAPLSRPLYIYTRQATLKQKPEVVGFVKFYLDEAETLVPEVGYVPMPTDTFAQQEAKLQPFLPS